MILPATKIKCYFLPKKKGTLWNIMVTLWNITLRRSATMRTGFKHVSVWLTFFKNFFKIGGKVGIGERNVYTWWRVKPKRHTATERTGITRHKKKGEPNGIALRYYFRFLRCFLKTSNSFLIAVVSVSKLSSDLI